MSPRNSPEVSTLGQRRNEVRGPPRRPARPCRAAPCEASATIPLVADSEHLKAITTFMLRDARAIRKRKSLATREHQGITVRVDRPAGYVQRGEDEKGQAWTRTYQTDYGYIPGTHGGDGESLDVYLGPSEHAPLAYWISQRKQDGSFDEYKLMLGFHDRRAARSMWAAHTPEKFYGGIATTTVGMVKALLGLELSVRKAIEGVVEVDRDVHEVTEPVRKALSAVDVAHIAKADDELRYVLGVVLEPDRVDAQGDTIDAETIRKACWIYMTEFQNRGLQHEQLVNQAVKLVECWITKHDETFGERVLKAGTWLAGFHVPDDDIWAAVKEGRLTGLSIGGVSTKHDPESGAVMRPPPDQARFAPSR